MVTKKDMNKEKRAINNLKAARAIFLVLIGGGIIFVGLSLNASYWIITGIAIVALAILIAMHYDKKNKKLI